MPRSKSWRNSRVENQYEHIIWSNKLWKYENNIHHLHYNYNLDINWTMLANSVYFIRQNWMYGPPQPPYGPGYGQPGYGQPVYLPPQQPQYPPYGMPPPQGPTIIHINNDDDDGTLCPICGVKTSHIPRRKVGAVACAWGFCLLFTTAFLFWLPCCMDGCKDVELVCVKCQSVKNTLPANCCWAMWYISAYFL